MYEHADLLCMQRTNLTPNRPGLCMNMLTYSVCRDFLDFILHHFILLFYLSVHHKLQKRRLVFVKTFVNHVLWGTHKGEEEEEEQSQEEGYEAGT